jgi:hypothetical protein
VKRALTLPSFLCLGAAAVCCVTVTNRAQAPEPTQTPAIITDAVKYQLEDLHHTTWALRYRVHRIDDKEDSERDLIETRDGNVARTLMRHGRPLTPEEDAAEKARLEHISAADLSRRHKQSDSSEKYGTELIAALPRAMIFTPVAGQPQLPQGEHPQAVYDFAPNPQFHPSTTSQEVLPCLNGRVWIDSETHHLVRIELTVVKNVNLMMGILARVYSGGTLSYEQHPVGGGHYAYTRMEIDVKLRELMVKVLPYHATFTATDVAYMPTPPPYKEAVKMLLENP